MNDFRMNGLTGVVALTASMLLVVGPVSPVYADSSQRGEDMVILNPGGGQEADGSDGIRIILNGNNDETSELGSDEIYYAGKDNWCCSGAGPVLAVGTTAYGEAGAAAGENLGSWDTVVVSAETGEYELVAAGAGFGSDTDEGSASVTITYTKVVGGLTYTIQRDVSYVYPNNYYDETWTFTIPASNADEVKFYLGGDAAPGDDDNGIGSTVVRGGLRSVREANPDSGQYIGYTELNAAQAFTHYFVGYYDNPYADIASGGDLDDSIDTDEHDAGMQIQWTLGSTPGTYVRTMRTTAGYNTELEETPAPAVELSVPGIFLTVAGHVGRTVGESPVYYGAVRVAIESSYSLTVRPVGRALSTATLLAEGTIDADGSFSTMVRLPQLTPGNYLVTFEGKHANGATLEITCPISVGLLGTITEIGENVNLVR